MTLFEGLSLALGTAVFIGQLITVWHVSTVRVEMNSHVDQLVEVTRMLAHATGRAEREAEEQKEGRPKAP